MFSGCGFISLGHTSIDRLSCLFTGDTRYVIRGRISENVMRVSGLMALLIGMTATPALGQYASDPSADPNSIDLPISQPNAAAASVGLTADSAAGRPGIRQTRAQVESINPMARVDNRIQNRIKTRISNRIDRFYDPRTNAALRFEAANQATALANQ